MTAKRAADRKSKVPSKRVSHTGVGAAGPLGYFEYLINYSNDIILLVDENLNIIEANDRALQAYDYTRQEIIGLPATSAVAPGDIDSFHRRVQKVRQKGEVRAEAIHRRKDGSIFPVEISSRNIKIDGKSYILATVRDITQRKQAEQALRDSEERYRALVQQSLVGIGVSQGNKIIFVNQALLDMFGYTTLEEYANQPLLDHIAISSREFVATRMKELAQGVTLSPTFEVDILRKNGEIRTLQATSSWITLGGETYTQTVFEDITDRKLAEQSLRQSEEKYRSLVEHAPDIVWSFSGKRGTIYTSSRVKDILGYSPEYLYKNPMLWNQSIHPDDQPRVTQAIIDFAGGKEVDIEYRIKNSAGDWLWFHDRSIGREELNGEVIIHGISTDVTERKRVEERVRVANERLEYLISSSSVVMYSAEVSGNYPAKFISRNVARLTGYQPEEFLESDFWHEHVHPDDRDIVSSEVLKIFDKSSHSYEYRFRHKDGKYIWVRDDMKLVRDEADNPVEIIGAWSDITERKQTEAALRQSEERYRTILEGMDDSYYEVDLAGNFTFVNDSMCRRFGFSREELIGMNYRAYTPDDRHSSTFTIFNQVYRSGEAVRGIPSVIIGADGASQFVERSIFPMRNDKGEIVGFRGISRDVTQRKLAEEERKQLELKAQISSRLASVGEMAAGVAHEINNPLTGITGYAQLLLERKDLPEHIIADLEAINDGARRVAGIVQRLLAFSRQTKPERKLVDINELIESTLVLRAYHLRVNNIDVVTRLAPGLLQTVVDPGQIQQVLLNLIVNSETEMKLAHDKGKLTVTTEITDNIIKVSVKDNGPGIRPEIMERIFDPFFTTRDVGQGTGLGLSLCYGIMAEHNGRIYAKSHPGKGATFIIELPIITEVAPLEQTTPVAQKRGKKMKASILVVDDENIVRDIAKRVLSAEGHKVDISGNGLEALSKIKGKEYDLILLDIKMPGMNGIDLYKRIQKVAQHVSRKVVFMTGDIMGPDTEKFLDKTRASHIEKPFDAKQLNTTVHNALNNSRD